MSFNLKHSESISEGLVRIICDELDDAIDHSKDPKGDLVEAVHEIRKSTKKIRSLLRLCGDIFGKSVSKYENVFLRDIAHQLSDARDSQILIDAFAKLKSQDPVADYVLEGLAEHRNAMNALLMAKGQLVRISESLSEARDRISAYTTESDGWSHVEDGLRRAYKRGQAAFETACSKPAFITYHEWRKRVKDLLYDIRVLEALWPEPLEGYVDSLHHLSDLLGDDHDFGVLEEFLRQEADNYGGIEKLGQIFIHLDGRREQLRDEAKGIGVKLYDEKPKAFAHRLEALWNVW